MAQTPRPIKLLGVRQNNLKNISVEFPSKKLTVVTGLSGSGKSSLVFDTLYAEGQRRYIESLSTYTRQFLEKMPKPDIDGIENIPPAIALEQKNHVVNSRSTVGTQTEIIDYLRVLYARTGVTVCPDCQKEVGQIGAQNMVDYALETLPGKKSLLMAPVDFTSSKKKSAKAPTAKSIAQILKSQGFGRIVIERGIKKKSYSQLDLEEKETLDALTETLALSKGFQIYVVVDRFKLGKLTASEKDELRGRLRDSIDQGLMIGRGKLAFLDLDGERLKAFDLRFACQSCGREFRKPEPNLFSFNSPVGACSHCTGFGFTLDLDETLIVPNPTKTLKGGAIDPLSKPSFSEWQGDFFRFAERHGISIAKRYAELTPAQKEVLWKGDPSDKTFPGILGCFEDLKRWKYKLHIRVFIRRYQSQTLCRECLGARLNVDARSVFLGARTLPEVTELPIRDALGWLRGLKLTSNQKKIAAEPLSQIERRLDFLDEVGVGYLTLSRLAKSLSGGEFQRISLATQLGNGLCGTLYVLDEPSIGLHASDTSRLIRVLKRLRDQGNTVVVVEHDLSVMRSADHLIELGPGAGFRGGELTAAGDAQSLSTQPASLTAQYLSGKLKVGHSSASGQGRPSSRRGLRITGCRENNLKDLSVDIPLDRMVVVTGVSGSGKSTLVHKTLTNALMKLFYHAVEPVGKYDRLYGAEQISGVVLLDQSPIGRSSRSNPVTYLKAWDEFRRLFANQSLSLKRGYTPQHFSFNVDGGRCPVCKGEGEITLDMHFMAEIKLPCEECDGKRFKRAVLDVRVRGKNVWELLQTTIDEAYELFRDHVVLRRKLGLLREVGLGYLQMGQSGTTLSGGESQRLKVAATLDEEDTRNLLYVFDEPTTGLHLEDVKKLMRVVQDLVDAKNSVLMIEHHLDVIAQADWVIDLGPGGGDRGGDLIAAGTPYDLTRNDASITGRMLREEGYFPSPVLPEATL